MNKVDPTKQIQSTMGVATDILEFLDLKLKFDKEIFVNVFAKDTNSLPYVLLTLKTSLNMLFYILEKFAILMTNLKCIVQNIKTI